MPLIPALGRQRQASLKQSEFQDSQGFTEKPCLEKPKNQKKKKKKKTKQKCRLTEGVGQKHTLALSSIPALLPGGQKTH
jgi:hypothetical protein